MAQGSLAPVSRTVTFAPGLGAAAGGWAYLGQPLHWAGLGAFLLAGLTVWPWIMLSVILIGPAALAGLVVPRGIRGRYRRRLIERGIPRERQRSSYISRRLRRVTFAADRHRCTGCKTRRVRLEWDHIHPWIAGGPTVLWNGGTLCEVCNGIKLNYNRERDGYEHYAGNRANIPQARTILRRERRHRWNPLRWTRAAWALAS
jgi:hypothetical protein